MNDPSPWRLPAPPDARGRRFATSRFAGFDEAYGTYDHDTADLEPGKKFEIKATARLEKKPVTFDLWRDHLQGIRPLGIIPIRRDNTASGEPSSRRIRLGYCCVKAAHRGEISACCLHHQERWSASVPCLWRTGTRWANAASSSRDGGQSWLGRPNIPETATCGLGWRDAEAG